jgi:hypothetical protein
LALYNPIAYAENKYRYQYFSLQNVQFPPGYNFFNHTALGEDGKVYGQIFNNEATATVFGVFKDGVLTTIQSFGANSFNATTVNNKGLIGGFYTDWNSFFVSAVFDNAKLIQLPGEGICDLTDAGTELVRDGVGFSIVKKGIESPIDFGPIVPIQAGVGLCGLNFNNQEAIAGSTTDPSSGRSRGFVLAKGANQQPVLLNPKESETDSIVFDINNQGNVFGFSYNPDGIQRVGLWQKKCW